MDVKRDPAILKKKKIRQMILGGIALVVLVAISVAVSRLKPAAPSVDDAVAWKDTVKRGDMVRNVRGSGTLVPEDTRQINTTSSGRVERILLRGGAPVRPDTVILVLSNPDLQQAVATAELNWRSGLAQLENRKADLRNARLQLDTSIANAQSRLNLDQLQYESQLELSKLGLVGALQLKQNEAAVDSSRNNLELLKKQLQINIDSEKTQIAPQEADVASRRAAYETQMRNLEELKVKAGMNGVLQTVAVEVGQPVGPGTNLARVADPTNLKAQLRISETQTRDLAIGQVARVDTRNGIVMGHVSRIDPSAVGGTVGVDVILEGELPAGARPDLSVDGEIELELMKNVLKIQRPAFGQENATVHLFKLTGDGEAVRTQVKLGKASVSEIIVLGGLNVGDTVILSDMSAYDAYERVRLTR